MPHIIEIFSGGCPICKEITDIVSVGKCKECQLIIHDLRNSTTDVRERMRDYGVTSVPTIIIDSKIRVVGTPDFPWFCSDDFYRVLERDHPLTMQIEKYRKE